MDVDIVHATYANEMASLASELFLDPRGYCPRMIDGVEQRFNSVSQLRKLRNPENKERIRKRSDVIAVTTDSDQKPLFRQARRANNTHFC